MNRFAGFDQSEVDIAGHREAGMFRHCIAQQRFAFDFDPLGFDRTGLLAG